MTCHSAGSTLSATPPGIRCPSCTTGVANLRIERAEAAEVEGSPSASLDPMAVAIHTRAPAT